MTATQQLHMISKPTNAHKNTKVYYTHRISATRFGQSHGHLQRGALQWTYYRSFELIHRSTTLNFKNYIRFITQYKN